MSVQFMLRFAVRADGARDGAEITNRVHNGIS